MYLQRHCIVLALILVCTGCNSRPATVAIQGTVSYAGRPVERGSIDFVPTESTPGGSANASIQNGHYAVDQKWGLRPDGVYLVQITAFRKSGKVEPNRIKRGGPPLPVMENFMPEKYNTRSGLKVRVSELSNKDRLDFDLQE
jgi:hypothetical protein